jgi:hypothetical protein
MKADSPILTGRHTARRAALALALLAALLAAPAPVSERSARAAPAAQAQNLCTLVPPGYDPGIVTDMADYCYVVYNEPDGTMLNLELSRFYSPLEAYRHMPCDPGACASGQTCNSTSCFPYPKGDLAPAGIGHNYQGVGYATSSLGGYAYAWTRGCYLEVTSTLWSTDKALMALLALNAKADALIATGPCAGCNDPSVCQGTGTGTTSSVCGPGVEAPAGTFAVSGYGCQYEEASDGVTCQAAVVNACPNATLKYTWSLDGTPAPGYTGDLFNATNLGLCAGTHTVTVSAEDTQNNLNATGLSWPFTSTQGSPCAGGTGASLSVTSPSCGYLATEDRVLCTTQVAGAPDDADIVFEWTWDGAVQSGTASGLDIIVSPDGKAHTVQVTARDRACGKTSAPASASVQVGGGGGLWIETGTGTATLDGRALSEGERLVFMPNEFTKILADCPLLGLVLLLDLRYDTTSEQVESGTTPAVALIASLLIECGKLKAEGPLRIASLGNPALFLPAQAAPEDLPVQLRLEMLGGPLRVNAVSDQVLVDVQTSEASVRSAGQNDFGVNFDAQTGDTTVAVYGGSVEVYSMSSALQLAALRQGEQVTVSQGQASEVTHTSQAGSSGTVPAGGASVVGPIEAPSGEAEHTGASASGSSSTMAALLCCPLLAVAVAIAALVLVRRRRRSAGAPPVAATSPDRPVAAPPARPVAAAQGRALLVVLQGAAQQPSLPLTGDVAVLGSDPSCTLVLHDPLVSAQHASLAWYRGAWVLSDASTNGTFVNGVRITRQELRPGDVIQMGSVRLAFQTQA